MEAYEGCIVTELDSGHLLLSNVALSDGVFSQIYLGFGGVCAVTESADADPQILFSALRSLLGTVRVNLFLRDFRRYDPVQRSLKDLPGGVYECGKEIQDYLLQEPYVNTPEKIQLMREKLVYADACTRGYYRDDNGTLFLLRGSDFHPVSEMDPEHLFRLTFFGGFLGLHRFSMRKYMSGVFYLFTCGFFLLGWLLDILQLLAGIQRDRSNSLVLPPDNRRRALYWGLPAMVMGFCALFLYTQIYSMILDSGNSIATSGTFLSHLFSFYGL